MDHPPARARRARRSADHGRTQLPFLADRSSLLYRRPQGGMSAPHFLVRRVSLLPAMRRLALAGALGGVLLFAADAYPYEAVPVTNGGTIVGIVKFDGIAPK